jgi:hypothetical protein
LLTSDHPGLVSEQSSAGRQQVAPNVLVVLQELVLNVQHPLLRLAVPLHLVHFLQKTKQNTNLTTNNNNNNTSPLSSPEQSQSPSVQNNITTQQQQNHFVLP